MVLSPDNEVHTFALRENTESVLYRNCNIVKRGEQIDLARSSRRIAIFTASWQ